MRLHITNSNEELAALVHSYLLNLLTGKRVDLILNGEKTTGVIKEVALNLGETPHLSFFIGAKELKVPLFDDTEGRLGKELVVMQTRNHSTVIEILD